MSGFSIDPLLLPSCTEAAWFQSPDLDEDAHLTFWEKLHEQQMQAVRAFNSDIPIMGREGRVNQIVSNDDTTVDPDEDDPEEDDEEELDDELQDETEEEFDGDATDEPEY